MNPWQPVEDDLYLFRDSCHVYAVRGAAGQWLVVNAGTGAAAGELARLGPVGGTTLLLTHFFRDHSAGAARFKAAGASVLAPWLEREHLAGDQRAFRGKQIQLLYDTAWDHFAPVAPLAVDRWLHDYEVVTLAGLPVEVVPAPGATLGAAAYVVTLRSGRRVAFVGEMLAGPGRLPRLSPLQYNYNDLTGAENVLLSWERVLATGPARVCPSLGEPLTDAPAAVARLRASLVQFDRVQPGFAARLAQPVAGGVEEVIPRLYRATHASAETHFVVGRSGRILALDFGYDTAGIRLPPRIDTWNRRPLLHSIADLRAKTGADRIDTVLVTHYHDDHVGGVPLLQRRFGTALWAGDNFADLLEHPDDHDRPCTWPEPMKVARRVPLGQPVQWDDVTITLHPMTGHTEYSTLVLLEFDGRRVAHTGDQIFFAEDLARGLADPAGASRVFTNHVYRNGLALGGYADCVRHLREFNPELVLSGHWRPYRPTPAVWAKLDEAAAAFDEVHRALLPLGESDVHFGAEGQAAKLQPHQQRVAAGATGASLRGWVLNPFAHAATAEIALVTPPTGWSAAPVRLALGPREKRGFAAELAIAAGASPGRQPIALDLTVDGRRFGQVAEAWIVVT